MIDRTLVRGILFGSGASFLLFLAVVLAGHLPRRTEPVRTCLCPDSAIIEQPRSLESNQRN